MRADIKLTLIYVTIGFIAVGATAYFLYQDRKKLWREYARSTFAEVLMISKDGKRTYSVPIFKLDHNIEDDFDMRILQSCILEMHPLVADSLNLGWVKTLHKMGFLGRNIVRVSVTDLLERETKYYSNDSSIVNEADSLSNFYISYCIHAKGMLRQAQYDREKCYIYDSYYQNQGVILFF